MNSAILQPEVQDYINEHLKTDPTTLILKGTPLNGVSATEVVQQIEAKNRCEKKLPTWFNQPNIYYPNKINIEQTSSELTAIYKSKLIEGKTIIDLTGGFGIDSYYFSKVFENVTHCEINEELSKIVVHNFKILKKINVNTILADGLSYLKNSPTQYDWIYVDPSRRHDSKGKVVFLKDCLPNIPEHLSLLWEHSNNILIKTSPLLDISLGIQELEYVKSIHIIAINNEVKELLWILEKGFVGKITIKTAHLKAKSFENFDFLMADESQVETLYSEPLSYLYEPNAAIMKSGGFSSMTSAYQVAKLHKHSHLYTSELLIEFPGRTFKIIAIIPYTKKEIKKLSLQKANITIRNFPETVQNIRKSTKIKDGGEDYLFFTTNVNNEKIVVVCSKIQ